MAFNIANVANHQPLHMLPAWQEFERHLTDALNLAHTDANGDIHLNDADRTNTGKSVSDVLARLRSFNTLPMIALRNLEDDHQRHLPLLLQRTRRADEEDEWVTRGLPRWRATNKTGRGPSQNRATETENRVVTDLAVLDEDIIHNDLRKLVVDAYRRHIRQHYPLGSPDFNRYYF
jgi:hypothetical protein